MASAAVDGAVLGLGGLPPVTRMTTAITTTRHASQPRMNARPFLVPRSALRIRMKAVIGKGSRAIASPMIRRSITTPHDSRSQRGQQASQLAGPGSGGFHRPCSAVIFPAATASTSAWWSRSFWSAYAAAN